MEIKKYVVIGFQYENYCYGTTDSLQAAKVLATKHEEYWDNWQGWHTPDIYRGEDCKVIEACGMITHFDGEEVIVPVDGARPAFVKGNDGWRAYEEAD